MSRRENPDKAPFDTSEERASDEASVVRHEEELRTGTTVEEAGAVRARKSVETFPVQQTVERNIEQAEVERLAPAEQDSGEVETLPDGSVSIPIFEEELVVTKRLVVRERVVVRKSTVIDEHVVEAELKRERVDVVADPDVEGVVDTGRDDDEASPAPPPSDM